MSTFKLYSGMVPSCGVFCGGCPNFLREKRTCPGASIKQRCQQCTSYHLCCVGKGITHCFQCSDYPCKRFKAFRKRWLKYGQDFLENQDLLRELGTDGFLEYWNEKEGKDIF